MRFLEECALARSALTAWRGGFCRALTLVMLVLLPVVLCFTSSNAVAREFGAFTAGVMPSEVFPDADDFGPMEGKPPAAKAMKGGQVVGYVFSTNDIGYSGKPIRLLVGMSNDGVIVGGKVLEHHEPILLVGIPEKKLFDFITGYVGKNVISTPSGGAKAKIDMISGATVTAIVINDSITRTAVKIARSHGIAGFKPLVSVSGAESPRAVLAAVPFATADWQTLLGDGSLRRMFLTNGDVDATFAKIGVGSPEPYGKAGDPAASFIDLYAALVTPERIGRNLLGEAEYANMKEWLGDSRHAVLIVANGDYSYRGSGFVRGGIFDRFQLIQHDTTVLFHDHQYRRLGTLADGMPIFTEIGIFKLPPGDGFDPTEEWRLDLLAQRPIGPIEKVFTSFSLPYSLPAAYITRPVAAVTVTAVVEEPSEPLWMSIWRTRLVDVTILVLSIGILTGFFFFQDILVRYPKLVDRLRLTFMLFSVLWIGVYAQAQLSVVNALTFINALLTGFRWDFFLLEPLIFILWSATAVSLLFWGRGAYCGWLCPVGALQDLLNRLARTLKIRQITVPFAVHERLWAVKYIVFLILLGVSLQSMAKAEILAEVEPFKTIVILHFMREWPFVVYALLILGVGVFIERAFCRYLCPLGAALAIPARMRMFEWLKRRRQCGHECTICSRQCTVQAIHPSGTINPHECLYCLECQTSYFDDTVCPPLILRRTKREKRGGGSGAVTTSNTN